MRGWRKLRDEEKKESSAVTEFAGERDESPLRVGSLGSCTPIVRPIHVLVLCPAVVFCNPFIGAYGRKARIFDEFNLELAE